MCKEKLWKDGFVHRLAVEGTKAVIYRCETPTGKFVCWEIFTKPTDKEFPDVEEFGINYNSIYMFDDKKAFNYFNQLENAPDDNYR